MKRSKKSAKSEDVNTLTINEDFAKKYDEEQSKLAFSRNTKKGARQSEYDKLIAEMEQGDDGDEGDEGDDEEEDEEGKLLTPQVDRVINEALAAIRRKDKDFLSKATQLVVEGQLGKSSKNAASVKSVLAKQALNDQPSDEEEAGSRVPETTVAQQERLKREFLKEAKTDEDESDEDLFTVKTKTPEDLAREAEETVEGKKALETFFKRDQLTDDDAFMKNYLGQEWWKAKDLTKLPSYKDITGEDPFEHPDTDEDDAVLDAQDNFESGYNFRFQEGGAAAALVSYPRVVADSVRQTTSKRKRQRESKAERDAADKLRRAEELNKLKSIKRKEIQDKVQMLKVITGTGSKAIEQSHLKLDRPFDPEEHDRMMSAMFDNEYYQEEDEAIQDEEIRAEIVGAEDEDLDIKPGKFLRADVQKAKKFSKQKKKNQKKAAKLENETFGGDFGVEEANLDDATRKEAEKVQEELQSKIKELANLDFEDVIGGDIKCHFHYREVQPKDFGMTTEEILNASDKELNQMASIKKLAPFRPDANSNTPWWEMKGKRKTKAAKLMREQKRLERQKQNSTASPSAVPASGSSQAKTASISKPSSSNPPESSSSSSTLTSTTAKSLKPTVVSSTPKDSASSPALSARTTTAVSSKEASQKKRKHSHGKTGAKLDSETSTVKPEQSSDVTLSSGRKKSTAARRRAREKKSKELTLQGVWGKKSEAV